MSSELFEYQNKQLVEQKKYLRNKLQVEQDKNKELEKVIENLQEMIKQDAIIISKLESDTPETTAYYNDKFFNFLDYAEYDGEQDIHDRYIRAYLESKPAMQKMKKLKNFDKKNKI